MEFSEKSPFFRGICHARRNGPKSARLETADLALAPGRRSVAFTFAFACAAPFAGFAAAAACTLPRRDAYWLAGAVWLANQGVGFGFLHYPWTMDCLTWGVALGLTALLSTLAAHLTMQRLTPMWTPARIAVTFLAAFAAYEATLIIFSLLLGGIENYTPATQGRILEINAIALVGLLALNRMGIAAGLAPSFRFPTPLAAQHV